MSSPPSTPDSKDPSSEESFRFHQTGTPCEWAESYHPGGFHPAHFGDVFCNRYEVIRKLGNGSFGTVWLAFDSSCERYVALKIEVAKRKEPNEVKMQRLLAEKAPENQWSEFVVGLLDSFYHQGPNGNHLCLVLEPMGPSLSAVLNAPAEIYDPRNPPVRRFAKDNIKRILGHVLSGLLFLHDNGVVHGDLQCGNILFALEDLARFDRQVLRQAEDTSNIDILRRIDGKLDKWAPKYLAVAEPMSDYALSGQGELTKLSDLGGAFCIDDPPLSVVTPVSLRAPEAILNEALGTGIDMWSFGCLVYELFTGTALFQLPPFGLSDNRIKDEHLIQLTDIIGPLPETLSAKWPNLTKYYGSNGERLDARPMDFEEEFSNDGNSHHTLSDAEPNEFDDDMDAFESEVSERGPPQVYESLEELIRAHKANDMDDEEEKQIVSLLRSVFQYDPSHRPFAAALLEDPWLAT
ncbi:serine/threonine-protein kinase SRPK3 [Colletotrichum orchidophilum]|uniref:Serine/threonine-protein kinase SRPK3 n=1 Tax=Colletotrichum orchidophilum TaxID=1209926 RepID=A0A1G4BAL3_9PEZI|nr:serine/threonine-protein kinase SRPK3 [Colletotrichum orchidophilum]OHE98451.1 serine/threonine-protein kinase SRPK3 [Colletotrichum orchidophilum]